MKCFWTTWVEGTNGGYGRPHSTFEDARAEAERLALCNPRKEVRVLQCLGVVICKDTTWEEAEIKGDAS